MIEIAAQRPEESGPIEALLDEAFGPGRLAKSSYSYRAGIPPLAALSLVARDQQLLVATFRCWPIAIGDAGSPAILVGPIAVATERHGQGIGAALIRHGLALARAHGHALAVLVGDLPYYGRFGFTEADRFGIVMARENPHRVLALTLDPQAAIPNGLVRRLPPSHRLGRAA